MLRIAFLALTLILAAALHHHPARAATSEFDGRWSITFKMDLGTKVVMRR